MYKRISVLFFSLIFLLLANTSLYAQHIKGQLFVKAKEGIRASYTADQSVQGTGIPKKLEAIYKKFGVTEAGCPFILDDAGLKRTYLVTFKNADQTRQLMAQLQQTNLFEYVEQVPEYKLFATPNDIDSRQWNLAKINATLAWDHALGSNRVVLAMVDDAVRIDHEDLKDVIWTNTGEIAGNGIDDDNNGYIDDVNGWDAADNDNDPAPPGSATSSYFTHGTHCAGIAAATTDNATGIASISYNISLMPVKIADDATSSLSGAWQGVQYAIKAKANVISMSWGGGGYSSTYQQILTYAHNQGIVLVAAAGNNNSSIPMYPAAYKYVISVASTDNGDFKSYFSNYGSTIDVAAPGSNIWSTLAGSTADYGYLSGTSMACPLVSGLTALMLSRAPNATPDEIEACLKNGCDNIDAQNPSYIGQLGAGRINAYKAVTCLPPITADFGSNQTFACLGDTIKFQDKSVPSSTSWTWSFPGGTPSTATVKNPKVIYNTAGKYDVTLIASNAWGSDTITRALYIEAGAPTATISGNYTITQGYSANLKLDFTGAPPYTVVISNGSTTDTLRNINSSLFYYNVKPAVTTSYTITAYQTSSCSGSFSGKATVPVEAPVKGSCFYAVKGSRKVSDTTGNFSGTLNDYDTFAETLKNIGDRDGDGIDDLGASQRYSNDGGTGKGAFWILCMNADGTVKSEDKISSTSGNFSGTLGINANFGYSVADIGDIDGDGIRDLASGAIMDGAGNSGVIWILFMNANRTVKSQASIRTGSTNFTTLNTYDELGFSIVGMGDINGDGVPDIAASAPLDDAGGTDKGAVYIILLNANGSVKSYQKIGSGTAPFSTLLDNGDNFGFSLEMLPDIDKDGINELMAGAYSDDDGGTNRGAIYLLHLNSNGSLKRYKKISSTVGNINGLSDNGRFGRAMTYVNNPLQKSFQVAVTAYAESDNGTENGAAYLLTLDTGFTVKSSFKISNATPNFTGKINNYDYFGASITTVGDYDHNGMPDIACSMSYSDDGGTDRGAFYTIFLKDSCSSLLVNCDLAILNTRKVSDTTGGFTGFLKNNDEFAGYLKNIGDWDGDGVEDLAASNRFSTDGGGSEQGAFWILCMNPDGTVKTDDKISATSGNFTGTLDPIANFGYSIANIGDIDGDGVNDLAAGAPFDAPNRNGAVWILRMNSNRTVKAQYKIGTGSSNFTSLNYVDLFGTAVTGIGDIDNDGVPDIAVNASGDDNGGTDRGAVYIILLNSNGTVKSYKKMSSSSAPFNSLLDNDDMFGWSLEKMRDLDGDGISELLIGSIKDDDGGTDRGAIYLVYLNNTGAPKRYKKLSTTSGNFQGLSNYSSIARSISLYQNSSLPASQFQIIVGALNDSSNTNSGAVYLLTLDTNFTALKQFRINNKTANFTNKIFTDDRFGYSVTCVGDYDGNGVADIAASILYGDDGGSNRGGFFTIFLSDSCSELIAPVCKLNGNFAAVITCLGDSVTFIDRSIDSNNRRIIYREWDFGDGKTVFGDSMVKHKYNAAGTYTVKLIIASSGTQACRDTITKQITVTDSMLIKAIEGRQLCKRDTMTLGLKEIHCASGQLTYRWFPGKWLDDSTLANPVARPLSSIKYYVEVTDQLNRKRIDSIYLDVDAGCCKSFAKATLDKYSICVGDTVRFTNNSTAEPSVTYKWKLGPGAKLPSYTGATPPPMPYLQAGADTIVLVLSDACGNDTFTTYLTVFPPPSGLSTDTLNKCGDTISYTGSGLNSNKYTWTPNIDISDEHSPNPVFSNSQTRKYNVTIQDPFTTCSVKDSLLVRVSEIIHILPHDTLLCAYDSLVLSTDKAADSYQWPDNSTGNTYKVKQPGGLIRLSYTSYGCSLRDSAQIDFQAPFNVNLGKDTSTCTGIQIILDAGDAQTYLWNTGAVSRTIHAGTQGWYRVDVTDTLGCKAYDSVFVDVTSGLNINLGNDTSICQGQQVLLDARAGVYFVWNTGANSQSILANTAGTYDVYARDAKGCEGRDTINVNVVPMPNVTLANDTLLCNGDSIQLTINGTADAYNWSTGSNSPSIWVKTSGTYIGRAINQSLCADADTVNILTASTPAPNLGPDTTICVNQTILLDLGSAQPGETYTWSDSSNNTSLLVLDPGKYFVTVTGECGTGSDTVNIKPGLCDCNLYIPNAFTPGNLDNLNLNETFKPSACNVTEFEMTIYDRWGEKLYHTTNADHGWDGMYKGQPALEGVYYYLIKVTYGQNDIKEKRKGMVHLLR